MRTTGGVILSDTRPSSCHVVSAMKPGLGNPMGFYILAVLQESANLKIIILKLFICLKKQVLRVREGFKKKFLKKGKFPVLGGGGSARVIYHFFFWSKNDF